MQNEFLIAGFGGQGVMFAGQLLAHAAMQEGLEVTWIPSYGPEMRGGTAHCFVVIADKPIGSPIVDHPGVGIFFNKPSLDKYASRVAAGELIALNASLIHDFEQSQRKDVDYLAVPASQLAEDSGDLHVANMVLLGAALCLRPILSLEVVEHALELHLPVHHQDMLAINFAALRSGADFAAQRGTELAGSR